MARSTYYYHIAHLPDPDKYEEINKGNLSHLKEQNYEKCQNVSAALLP